MGADYKDCVERKRMDGKQEYLHEIQKSFFTGWDKGWTESEKYGKIYIRNDIMRLDLPSSLERECFLSEGQKDERMDD